MKRKILIVTAAFYPEQSPRSFRATELAKEFALQGHTITVLTTRIKGVHDSFEQQYNIKIKNLGPRPKPSPIPETGFWHWPIRAKNRVLKLFFEYPTIKLRSQVYRELKAESGYDMLISIAAPHPVHWGVAKIWSCERTKPATIWVADCGDPFMQIKSDSFRKMFYFNWFENQFLKEADYISVPFEEMKSQFNSKYKYKFKVIPQGFKMNAKPDVTYKPNKIPTFIYSGVIQPGTRDPFSLIEYLEAKEKNYKFLLYTKQQHILRTRFPKLIGNKLILRDYILRKDLLNVLAKADFLINIDMDTVQGKRKAVPTKLIDYRISGRPILSYEHSNLPKEKVQAFLRGDYREQFIDEDFSRYEIENVIQKFLALIP